VPGAHKLFQTAADRGSPDGAMDLAVDLLGGIGGAKDPERALVLLRQASASGSARATYDLAILASQKTGDDAHNALDLFRQAAKLGYPEGYRAAAVLLDEGRGVPADPKAASDELLRAIAEDSGQTMKDLTSTKQSWTLETISAVQTRLKASEYYNAEIDGRTGPAMAPALKLWRQFGDSRHAAADGGGPLKD
jgi:TPR repeat protein